ncbi:MULTISPECIES: YajQ family cyclic di-GMP-binding protein [Dehalococcoides]|jgi:Uncharacterized protein conserved in bacteria|uniref:Nucleotide-binding protein cbdbA1256 n=3 Tax=Dehalococcoides mccartyi TaxID=61435 RepID=Y1256_DEHMC|nr:MULTISPECIES: YajQ family cyclic di-GMP-binding protein [Dehalococcoides]A5FQ25.1 RecName: Full=UPF0234 protein DehaBAV1_1126 [Dehalococcoides mccartyi BAV1]Q3ZYJ9.1 RecName: Full=UPF0234 protein cbdbA1256 [Dehalococcoides mccartyi CBDB1]AGG06774.1 hypothetical protein dcmb_1175 [Dehalococcoides mccartyi DCMB5]AGG08269.1 hypothetical protein btf_1194 [Dehalococcoides mccartyi BTF08]AII61272.1 hypothetical protein X794_05550 [Dehalococcoides mccartyi CG5]AMU86968.1 hypothetical protein Dm11
MPSLDVVSTVDMQAMDNAVNNAKRDLGNRYDFKNSKYELELNRKDKAIEIVAEDEFKLKAVIETLIQQCVRFKLDSKCLDIADSHTVSLGAAKTEIKIKDGLTKETASKITKFIKSTKLKLDSAIQGEQIRITGKQIDDLQEIMRLLSEQDFDVPLQYVNMKR